MHKNDQHPTEFRGNLYLFVDKDSAASDVSEKSGEPAATVFDDVFGLCEPGHMRWYLSGWAVGKNAQGRYCARTSLSKAKRFGTFIEAMDYVRKKRWSRPQESFYLVYELDGQKAIVSSLQQILRLDGRPDSIHPNYHVAEDPVLERMAERVGKIVATNAIALYRMFQHEGEPAARARFSNATYERLWGVLLEEGVVSGIIG